MLPVVLVGAGLAVAYMGMSGPANQTTVKSSIDGSEHKVQNLPDKQDAADAMCKVKKNLSKLIDHYKSDANTMADSRVKVMVERFDPNRISENDITANTTSYSENKGDKIVICMRDKLAPYKIMDDNTIMYVVLHEMAHLMTITIGHTAEFWANFRRLLLDGAAIGIYTPVNYTKYPAAYCGMKITDNLV